MIDPNQVCYHCMQVHDSQPSVCPHCHSPCTFKQDNIRAMPIKTILNGRYLIGNMLGCGGYGVTYLALDLQLDQRVVVKEYMPSNDCTRENDRLTLSCVNPEPFTYGLKHFHIEVEALKALHGIPEVCQCVDSFDANNTAYYVMPFLEGMDLLRYLSSQKNSRISYKEMLVLLMPVVVGLAKVHALGILHRDISPDNIYICDGKDGDGISAKLIDFGSARAAYSNISVSFTPLLKMRYAPIEQFTNSRKGENQGTWSDVYAFGATMYRCLLGKPPISAQERITGSSLLSPADSSAKCTPQQQAVIFKAMALQPTERFTTMLEFAGALISVLPIAEQTAMFAKYPNIKPGKIPDQKPMQNVVKPESALQLKSTHKAPFYAMLLDLAIFQGLPALLACITGSWEYLLYGFSIGVLLNTALQISDFHASPGEILLRQRLISQKKDGFSVGGLLLRNAFALFPPMAATSLAMNLSGRWNRSLPDQLCGYELVDKDDVPQRARLKEAWALQMLEGCYAGMIVPLDEGGCILGRDAGKCNLVFPPNTTGVSRIHCAIGITPEGLVSIEDWGGLEGVVLESTGKPIPQSAQYVLHDGEQFRIGREKMMLIKRSKNSQ